MKRLSDLDATFIGGFDPAKNSFFENKPLADAQGVLFDCPLCGLHKVLVWFRQPLSAAAVPPDTFPRPGRWNFSGSSIDDLTLDPSVDLSQIAHAPGEKVCSWHGWVKDGAAG